MNITYKFKIFWFEDQETWLESEKEKLLEKFDDSKIEFEIKSFKNSSGLSSITHETEIDIILMDFNLSGITGDLLISLLREKNILCDIIFYSQQSNFHDTLLAKEGVYTTARQNLGSELNKVVLKHKTLIENVSTIRGTFITSAIDLEMKMNEIIHGYFKLDEVKGIFFKENIIETDFFSVGAKIKVVKRIGKDVLQQIENRLASSSKEDKDLIIKEKLKLESTLSIFSGYDKEIMDVRNTLAHSRHTSNENGETIFRHNTKNEKYIIDEKWVRHKMKHLVMHSINLDRFKTLL